MGVSEVAYEIVQLLNELDLIPARMEVLIKKVVIEQLRLDKETADKIIEYLKERYGEKVTDVDSEVMCMRSITVNRVTVCIGRVEVSRGEEGSKTEVRQVIELY